MKLSDIQDRLAQRPFRSFALETTGALGSRSKKNPVSFSLSAAQISWSSLILTAASGFSAWIRSRL